MEVIRGPSSSIYGTNAFFAVVNVITKHHNAVKDLQFAGMLNARVRYDHYSTFGGTAHPRVALIYSPREKTSVKLLYGEAFRAPSDYELYFCDRFQRPSPSPAPEHISTTELVLERYLGGHIRVAGSVYHHNISDLISAQSLPDGLIQFKNIDRVRTNGVEMEVEGKWAHGLEVKANYAFQDAESSEDDAEPTNSPEHLANVNLAGPLIPTVISAGLDLHYVSSRLTLTDRALNGFVVPGLTLFSPRSFKGLDFSASFYDFSGSRYAYPGSVEHPEDAIYQDGRTFRLKLTYSFWDRRSAASDSPALHPLRCEADAAAVAHVRNLRSAQSPGPDSERVQR